jgi:zinc transport system substrate-binding protein
MTSIACDSNETDSQDQFRDRVEEVVLMQPWRIVGTCGLVVAVLAGCGSTGGSSTEGGKAKVVAAFYPVAAAAQAVGGDCVVVTNLTPAGAEPHDLELTPADVDEIEDAKVAFVMGDGFQPAVEAAADRRDGPTVELLAKIGEANVDDPHVWLDPVLYSKIVDQVRAELQRALPDCTKKIDANAARYQQTIDAVGREYETALQDCKRRVIVTAHEAFGHLAKRYGLTQEGIAGISPDEEPNATRLGDLADLVRKRGVTTIFTEELVSPRVADALAREAGGVKTETLNPLEGLTEREQQRGDDWASVMRANLTKLTAALGCAATR